MLRAFFFAATTFNDESTTATTGSANSSTATGSTATTATAGTTARATVATTNHDGTRKGIPSASLLRAYSMEHTVGFVTCMVLRVGYSLLYFVHCPPVS